MVAREKNGAESYLAFHEEWCSAAPGTTGWHKRSSFDLSNRERRCVHRFSGVQFCNRQTTKIPAGTVLLVQVAPRMPLSVVDFLPNKGGMKEFSPSQQDPNSKGFIDEEEGLIVWAFKGRIDRIFYVASAKDRGLCPSYYAEPENSLRSCWISLPERLTDFHTWHLRTKRHDSTISQFT